MIELIPDAERLSKVLTEAAAPAFFLGAVAGLISILMFRLSEVMEPLRNPERGAGRDTDYLLKRARLLLSAIRLFLAGGLCTTLLLGFSFLGALLKLQHLYGAAALFLLATIFVGFGLLRFFQEVFVSIEELRDFRRE